MGRDRSSGRVAGRDRIGCRIARALLPRGVPARRRLPREARREVALRAEACPGIVIAGGRAAAYLS
jgi:hypothetical protein